MKGHWSDCAVYNEPALPAGPCDCGGFDESEDVGESAVVLRSELPGILGDFLRKAASWGKKP